jgi:hypothetical protein
MEGLNPQQLQQLQAMMAAQAPAKALVEFRAGQMTMTGTTVTADKRRGKIQLISGDDGLVHFQWIQRPSGTLDKADDLIIFPRGATLEPVPECKDGRVFLLRIKQSTRKRFFWMQEPDKSKDADLCKQVNQIFDNPPPAQGGGMPGMEGMEGMDDFGGMGLGQDQLLSMFSGGLATTTQQPRPAPNPRSTTPASATAAATPRPAATPVATRPTTTSTSAATSTTAPAARPAATSSSSGSSSNTRTANDAAMAASLNALAQQLIAQRQAQAQQPTLNDVLDTERLTPVLNADQKLVEALLPLLPEGQRSPHDLMQQLRSPQLQSTISRLSAILNSPQYGQLMASFSLPLSGDPGVPGFVQAIQQDAKKSGSTSSTASTSTSTSAATSSSSTSSSTSASAEDKKKKEDDDKKKTDKK